MQQGPRRMLRPAAQTDGRPGSGIEGFLGAISCLDRAWMAAVACLFAAGLAASAACVAQQAPPGVPGRPANAAAQSAQADSRPQTSEASDAAITERTGQLAADSARLLKLASELKAEMDKTDKDTLSIAVIRKADEIERLARAVKQKMRLSAGAN